MSEPAIDDPSGQPPTGRAMSPAASRRRLGHELRTLREAVGLRLDEAGRRVQRSSATMSRLEGGKTSTRLIEVSALLDFYAERNARIVPPEVRERMLRLAADSRRSQWFEPFRDVLSGAVTWSHIRQYVEYETDATEIRNFEPELIPGLLQTRAYALAMAEIFFPGHPPDERARFAEFRVARQHVLSSAPDPVRLNAAIGESALRRSFGNAAAHRDQMLALRNYVNGDRANVSISVIPESASVSAALGGSFVVMSFGRDGESDLVYLETRSGGDFLEDRPASDRFHLYFDSLVEVAMTNSAAIAFIDDILGRIGGTERGSATPPA